MYPLVIVTALFLSIYRLTIEPQLDLTQTYKDLAHLFVGGLIAAALTLWRIQRWLKNRQAPPIVLPYSAKCYGYLALFMTVLEVICAVIGKYTGRSIVDLFGFV